MYEGEVVNGHYKSSFIYFDREIEMSCHRQQIALVGATSIDIVIVLVNMAIMEAHEARLSLCLAC